MCNVTILSARPSQIINNIIQEITIQGTVSDCQPLYSPAPDTPPSVQVVVNGVVTIGGNAEEGTVTAVLQVPGDLSEEREWSVILKGISEVPCGTEIDVSAHCASDINCAAPNQTFTLDCDCPSVNITKSDPEQRNCDENGNVEITFKVLLNNISLNGFFAGVLHTGHIVDNNEFTYSVIFPESDSQGQNLWTQQQNGNWSRTFTHHYPGGNFSNVFLSANLPPGCAGNYLVGDPYENGTVRTPNCPSGDCPDSLSYSVTRNSDNEDVTVKVINSECIDPGLYKITILSPNNPGDSFTWSLNNNVLSTPITDENDPNFPGVNGINRSEYVHPLGAGVTASIGISVVDDDCVTPGAISLIGCGEIEGCEETDWSEWSECVNCTQTRTRTIADCSQETETRDCASTPTNWSNWAPTGFCSQIRSRTNENCQNEIEAQIDWCCIWMWANIGLIALTALLVLITFCMLPITVVGSTFSLGTLTALNIGLLIASGVLAAIALFSLILWLIFCVFLNTQSAACFLLSQFIIVMGFLISISVVVGVILAVIAVIMLIMCALNIIVCLPAVLGCAAGAAIDFAWFGSILGIAVVISFFLCPPTDQ